MLLLFYYNIIEFRDELALHDPTQPSLDMPLFYVLSLRRWKNTKMKFWYDLETCFKVIELYFEQFFSDSFDFIRFLVKTNFCLFFHSFFRQTYEIVKFVKIYLFNTNNVAKSIRITDISSWKELFSYVMKKFVLWNLLIPTRLFF